MTLFVWLEIENKAVDFLQAELLNFRADSRLDKFIYQA
jgi:hypothetical protein